jgi:signal transduction histidine kinase
MILDESWFRDEVLPEAVKESLPNFFADNPSVDPAVAVWDNRGSLIFTTADKPALFSRRTEAEKRFSFVFTDWKIALASRHATPGQVARSSFLVNLGLSAALAVVLLGGLALTLRTASREMKLSQMKSDFVSNVSHELRTPLASIRVFGELLRLGRFDGTDKVREYGDYIETESRRLTQLINNLLDFASIESGRKSYRFECVDLRELVCETLKTFGVRLRQSGFRVTFDGDPGPLPPLRLDPGAIAQSLSNLLDNAVKYSHTSAHQTEDKEIRVGLRREGDSIVIAVQDHGVGIPRDEQTKIFDRFHRVGTGLVHDVKGSGLGLSIVQHIVEAHHGRVTVESRVGEGSTFSIHLPIEAPGLNAPVTAAARRPSEA